ncbi:MAG TPA: hypothetical protein PLJ71_20370 [Candidatus Hydrogenedentes bacterium]|nr:hypothetical protein [Candidatus Hydrogenedentota bacterium]HQM51048.1 hypothetical protein [Candidatus Hydrogenedentota bacterium]
MLTALLCVSAMLTGAEAGSVDVGPRLELLVDDFLVESVTGAAAFRLHEPVPQEIVITHDEPWEGNSCSYHTIFQDGPLYRMYYKCAEQKLLGEPPAHDIVIGYAHSIDGIHWVKPELGLFEFEGSTRNNIVWSAEGSHDFNPFIDTNPVCPPEERYKAVGMRTSEPRGLYAWASPDGLHWRQLGQGPIVTLGAFDTQNVAFWDAARGEYRCYTRDFRRTPGVEHGVRDVRTATSPDFAAWSEPAWLEYPGAPVEQLYTNQIIPYYRAPHIFLGFPTRYLDRGWSPSMEALPEPEHRHKRSEASPREGTALTDGLFMTSRDAHTFRRWDRTFLRPGLRTRHNWVYGDNYQNWGIVETASPMPGAPREISIYATESYWTGDSSMLRRFTLRVDGFVSLRAEWRGGEIITKPLVFAGNALSLNFATSAAGAIAIEIQDAAGTPLEGYALADCPPLFGDSIARIVTWKSGIDISSLAGRPIRLRFVMRDADLYSLQFVQETVNRKEG